jgi:hypothetical protein
MLVVCCLHWSIHLDSRLLSSDSATPYPFARGCENAYSDKDVVDRFIASGLVAELLMEERTRLCCTGPPLTKYSQIPNHYLLEELLALPV